jgi:hypothetical protein
MNHKKINKSWTTKAAMEQVYKLNLWGANEMKFYSGEGSHHSKYVKPYITVISSFLSSFSIPPVVCDLGCGDFNIGRQLVKYSSKYIGVDIVNDLILFNKKIFNQKQLEFKCLDLAKDSIPAGDCAIIRQVFQHLSNNEVKQILNKLHQFKFVIITEHIPKYNFIPNIDILSGQGIRLKKKSGLDVTSAPFNFKVIDKKQLLKVNINNKDELMVTTLYQMF